MSKEPASQMSLGLFESTSLSSSLALDWSIDLITSRGTFTEPDEADAAANDTAPAPDHPPARNFRLNGDRALAAGWRARAADNLAAIRLAAAIEAEQRPATPDEQVVLSRFIAFGATALANNVFRRNGEGFSGAWGELGTQLEQMVTREELASLARATQYAHYTPETQIRAIWHGLGRLGFKGGRILEPGCGTGLFFALMPEAIAGNSVLTGIEMDPVTARIGRLLYPNAWVRREDFTQSRLPEMFDLAIGNPPFSDRIVRGNDMVGRLHLSLHDYFIARSIERLAPGGLAAFVTSRWTMDKLDSTARDHIASMADLIGAIRLPEDSMEATAGTSVVADILFFQRRPKDVAPPDSAAWLELAEAVPAEDGEASLSINRYFIEHPRMVLGRHARTSSAFGPVYTCKPEHTEAFERRLTHAVENLPPLIHPLPTETRPAAPVQPRLRIGTAADGATIKEGSYIVIGNELMQVIDGLPQTIKVRPGKGGDGISAKHARIIRALIPVRDAIREVLRAQEADEPHGCAQARLRSAYTSFVRYFGPINQTVIVETTDPETGATRESQRRPNLQPFLDDPDVWLVASIEEYDLETNRGKQGAIFTQRVIAPPITPLITSAHDALAVTLHETGLVDIGHIAERLGQSRETVIAELGDAIFLDPQLTTETRETWLTADAYLSGPVRHKLAAAQAAAALDRRYARNVAALARIQPEDLRPSDITARLGAPWIPADIIAAFSEQVIGIRTHVAHTPEVAIWSVDVGPFASDARATSEWGTARRHAGLLLNDALNAAIPQIWDAWRDETGEHRELNTAETEAASGGSSPRAAPTSPIRSAPGNPSAWPPRSWSRSGSA
ncbi:MAG TPA: hypothetical protein VFN77_11535 [Acetobacteraceae bacterium]|nr:hypothetical protein [Acetobacteraceae bacterium]